MAEIDRVSIEERGVPGFQLMQKAGQAIARRLMATIEQSALFNARILCGRGNNGGDGFIIAAMLHAEGYAPRVALLAESDALSGDALTAFQNARNAGVAIAECQNADELDAWIDDGPVARLWVDAMLGTGASGEPRGVYGDAVRRMNQRRPRAVVAAVDNPTGVNADTGAVDGDAVMADIVYAIGLPKAGHVLPPGLDHCLSLETLDIGFPRDLIAAAESQAELLRPSLVDSWLPSRGRSAYKNSQGHVLIVAGSRGMSGAALLCARAALASGAGLITMACPASLLPLYAGGLHEAMTLPVAETGAGSFAERAFDDIFAQIERYDAVIVGPGLGRHKETLSLARRIFDQVELPLLIDGDGLAALTLDDFWTRRAPWVITPHPGEAAALKRCYNADVQSDRFRAAASLAHGPGAALLKGPCSVIAAGGLLWVNPTGNPAMASGGMGDALSGVIGALLGQGLEPGHAAAAGAYLHGLSADLLVEADAAEALSASQVIEGLNAARAQVRRRARDL